MIAVGGMYGEVVNVVNDVNGVHGGTKIWRERTEQSNHDHFLYTQFFRRIDKSRTKQIKKSIVELKDRKIVYCFLWVNSAKSIRNRNVNWYKYVSIYDGKKYYLPEHMLTGGV